ncbi:MAG: hypothetical protein QOE83_2455 [Actinomycetota bacterium]|jgi:hypothetical protein|nr:hypothetical protein [Actinomycetota bacterium]
MRSRTVGIFLLATGGAGILVSLPAPWSRGGGYDEFASSHIATGFDSPVLAILLILTAALFITAAATNGRPPVLAWGVVLLPLWCGALWVIAIWSAGFSDPAIGRPVDAHWGLIVLSAALVIGAVGYVLALPSVRAADERT